MQLFDIIKNNDFNTVYNELVEIFPEISRKHPELKDVYDFLLSQKPVSSKKVITYKFIEDDDTDNYFIGAEDKCFEANWNVVLGKEVIREEGVEISDLEIAVNALLCIVLLGFAPRRFAELQQEIRSMAE